MRFLELLRKEDVGAAFGLHRYTNPGSVDIAYRRYSRAGRHEVTQLDLSVRTCEMYALGTIRIDADENNVPSVARRAVDELGYGRVHDQLVRHVRALRELARKIDCHPRHLSRRWIVRCGDRVVGEQCNP